MFSARLGGVSRPFFFGFWILGKKPRIKPRKKPRNKPRKKILIGFEGYLITKV